ncbi:MAG TPA: hypothetical protein P5556_11195 [Candidatus Gastranaerophilales bacterium]|nr:hypothetical protein [Candidatus Gastranaerophilales bacterium]
MDNFKIIQNFFENLKCSECDNYFKKESVELVRREENNVVVRIKCSYCNKNLGLAILGMDMGEYKKSLKFQNDQEISFLSPQIPDDPINYDDVEEAHRFFSGLGADWLKHLPKQE